jgi:hypothetical protein
MKKRKGLDPTVTSQCSATALYQVSYHIRWLVFLQWQSDICIVQGCVIIITRTAHSGALVVRGTGCDDNGLHRSGLCYHYNPHRS